MKEFGTLIAGARVENERASTFRTDLIPRVVDRFQTLSASQDTASLFGLWQLPVGERLLLSFGGRYDKVSAMDGIATWRATAAYRIAESDTTLRASIGTGGKTPTLFQRFSALGTPELQQERSIGVDAGIDQGFFDNRLKLSVTAFANRFSNLILFTGATTCVSRCYENIANAVTSGVEAGATVQMIPGVLSASASYTYLHAKDAATNLTLARRPQHVGRAGFAITPTQAWSIEPSVTFSSERFSATGERQRLAPFVRLDVLTSYRITDNLKAHLRVENLTNARYQDVYNFGTTGRAYYAGVTATW